MRRLRASMGRGIPAYTGMTARGRAREQGTVYSLDSSVSDGIMTLVRHTPPNCRGSVMRALTPHWGALLALGLFLTAGLAVLDDYGVGGDDAFHRQTVKANLRYLTNGDLRAFTSALLVDHEKFYGIAFEAPLLFVERAFGRDARDIHLSRHLITHLFFLAGGLFAYMLARRLFGSRLPAVAAMLLFLLHPRLYAHSFFNSKDIPFLAMFVIALFLMHRAFKRDTLPAFVLLGVGAGLLVNLRIMGIVLLASIPALRALDFALASGCARRKRVLLTSGGFALAAALTIYALQPYLWSDPVRRAVEWWTTLSDHPYTPLELFRGTPYWSVEFPIEYLPVWFSITSPPFALALGLAGAAFVLVMAAKSIRRALRNGRLRFALLLAGCFAAPTPIVILLDANVYHGWRHLYFLWAPFSLLAAFGLHALASALRRGAAWRAAVYGAAGAGLAATAIAMALIHPYQQVSFNFFTDRMTPEHLREQYRLNYWSATRHALGWISRLESPPRDVFVDGDGREALDILPEGVLEHLSWSPSLDALVVKVGPSAQPGLALHQVTVYGSTLATVERKEDLRAVYEAAPHGELVLDAAFEVRRLDNALALVMEPCASSFLTGATLQARVVPVDGGDLPHRRRERGFDSLYFLLGASGALFDGKCVASLPLPRYPIAELRLSLNPANLMDDGAAAEAARRAMDTRNPLARAEHRAAYDIYLADGELAYLNDSCDPPETDHPFHLNVYPERVGDMPEERREHGFERFHFEFLLNGAFVDGGCAAFFPLPDYPVAAIQTGQHDGKGGNLWLAEFWIDPERRLAKSAAGASGEPVARGVFDVHLTDGALVYVKEPCSPADTEDRFFLHITPERVSDLPDERRERGFDNLDFAFFPNGALFEGKCAARIPLPEYAVASIRTGQHVSGVGEVWSMEFAVGK